MNRASGWTEVELDAFATADSLDLAAGDDSSRRVELGMVVVGSQLFVRAFRGPGSAWFRAAHDHGHGRVLSNGTSYAVAFLAVDPTLDATIDDAYRRKYRDAASLVTSQRARSATLEIQPR